MGATETKIKKIMIMAGGTGGHVMPALAVAKHLQSQGFLVHWMGTTQGIEARVVPANNIPISFIQIQGLRGKHWHSWVTAPFRITKAIFQAAFILRKEQPQVVLSMGGYVAGPGAIAAWFFRIPLILHEQNAIAGLTNRLLAPFSKKIMVAFPKPFKKHAAKIVHTGNPVRDDILKLSPPDIRWKGILPETLHVLVLGGSLGAMKLNEVLPQAMALIPLDKRPDIVHQTGRNNLEKTKEFYASAGVKANVTDFIEDMSGAYAWADVVVCRSGALTIAELCAAGLPSILVPFPLAVDDHQTANAKYLSDKEAAFLLKQSSLTPQALHDLLIEFIHNPKKRLEMAKTCRELATPLATASVAEHCLEVSCEA